MPKLNETFPSLTYFILENWSPKQNVLFIHFNYSVSEKNKHNQLKKKNKIRIFVVLATGAQSAWGVEISYWGGGWLVPGFLLEVKKEESD